jgi:beta-glucosidase
MEQLIDELYAKMPQEERIAQLKSMYMDDLFDEQGQLDTVKCRELIPFGIGHFSQFCMQQPRDPNELRDRAAAVQDWLMHHTPNGIPALLHEEVLTGINTLGATIYPQQIGQACSFNLELAELKTRQTSTALRRMGGVLALSPMVDVCRVPSFNRLEESYGEDGYLSAAMGVAFVRGLQQDDLTKGVGACSKHYLGYGGGGNAEEKELMEEILLPHEAMIRLAGSKCVMPGYHAMADSTGEKVNCVANGKILRDILRDYLGFDGMVVSDYTAIDQLPLDSSKINVQCSMFNVQCSMFNVQCSKLEVLKAAAAINGGNDVDFPFGANYQHLQEAIDQGLVTSETFEHAVKNVLRFKYRAGLLDKHPYLYTKGDIRLDSPEERKTAYDIATQSIVLLKNDSNLLPLTSHLSPLRILLTGPNANSIWAMCGDYTYPAMSYFWKKREDVPDNPHIVRLLEGMNDRKPDSVSILYSRGCDWTEEIETKFSHVGDKRSWEYPLLHRKVDAGEEANKEEALAMADSADVIVAAVGENVMLCGENRDRQGLRLPGLQEQYVEELIATGKPVVLVVFGGRAQVISGLAERCAAVIQAWYPGEEGGHAVADILYGNVSPSAKLSVSYPATELYEPVCYNYPLTSDPSPLTSKVQWPFGYGLSYTTFEYKHIALDEKAKTTDDYVNLSFEVKNTGKMAADEVAQIYLSPTDDSQPLRPIQLQGFARVSLKPGETKAVKVRLYTEQFGYYSNDGQRQWNIQPGTYVVKVGASSADIRMEERVTLKGDVVTKPLREHYFADIKIKN